MQNVNEGKEVSFVLASKTGRQVLTFADEALARQRASERGLRLLRRETVTKELEL